MDKVYIVFSGIDKYNPDEKNHYAHIDSVWLSKEKANTRCKELNTNLAYLYGNGYHGFSVEEKPVES